MGIFNSLGQGFRYSRNKGHSWSYEKPKAVPNCKREDKTNDSVHSKLSHIKAIETENQGLEEKPLHQKKEGL